MLFETCVRSHISQKQHMQCLASYINKQISNRLHETEKKVKQVGRVDSEHFVGMGDAGAEELHNFRLLQRRFIVYRPSKAAEQGRANPSHPSAQSGHLSGNAHSLQGVRENCCFTMLWCAVATRMQVSVKVAGVQKLVLQLCILGSHADQ